MLLSPRLIVHSKKSMLTAGRRSAIAELGIGMTYSSYTAADGPPFSGGRHDLGLSHNDPMKGTN